MPTYDEEKQKYLQCFHGAGNTHSSALRSGQQEELRTTPLVSLQAKCSTETSDTNSESADKSNANAVFPQYGLLGLHVGDHDNISPDDMILMNTNAPNSVFLCGSQGSGKSYTMSCMLENCLLKDERIGELATPMAGVVFHYDADDASTLAEAASLCSTGVKVNVLVSRSNYHTLEAAYKKAAGDHVHNTTVQPMLFQDHQLTVPRMLKLMAFSDTENGVPLYVEVINRTLRDIATSGDQLRYADLKESLEAEHFDGKQRSMMNMRLELLQSFCATAAKDALKTKLDAHGKKSGKKSKGNGPSLKQPPIPETDVFALEPGTLTIIDLSDPFVDPATACVLFDICLNLLKDKRPLSGLIVALDEAHKYLNKSTAAENFTDNILTTIREQRHNATRVIVATQEPTISERSLDLCSVSIVHRFNSPAWFTTMKDHLGGASALTTSTEEQKAMFQRIVSLQVGESLVFSPSSYVCMEDGKAKKLASGVVRMQTRRRLGLDRGQSVLAS